MRRQEAVKLIDHTLLTAQATRAEVLEAAEYAKRIHAASLCISPSQLPLDLPGLRLCTVIGFPSGAHTTNTKVGEAREACAHGADEIDMVVNLSWVKDARFTDVEEEIAALRQVVTPPKILKVIIESAALTDAEIVATCQAALRAGADFVKTSTGYHPSGGASVHAVKLMRATVGEKLGVKASGGIHSAVEAQAMLDAGANRLGLSHTESVLEGFEA